MSKGTEQEHWTLLDAAERKELHNIPWPVFIDQLRKVVNDAERLAQIERQVRKLRALNEHLADRTTEEEWNEIEDIADELDRAIIDPPEDNRDRTHT